MSDDKPVVEHATPEPPSRSPATSIAVLLGALLALFSVLMLSYAIVGGVYVIRHDFIQHLGGVNVTSDCFEAIMFLVIGAFSGIVSVRWLRGPRRTPPR